jgi:signal peptidase I
MNKKKERSLVVVKGEDMYPSMNVGEKLGIEAVSPKQIRVGDVIVFYRYVLIAHRVLGILCYGSEYFFLTRGDKCGDVDSPVSYRDVLGRVVGKSTPIFLRTRNKILFASLLLWYLLASPLLSNPVIRRLNKIAVHISSICLC